LPPSSRRSLTPFDDRIVAGLAAVAAVAGAFAPGAPTGLAPADAVLQGAVAALVTLAGGRARRWSILLLAAVAVATALGWTYVPALLALALALAMAARRQRLRVLGAVSAALAVQALLRQDPYLFQGASMLVGTVAVVPVLVSAHRRTRSRGRKRNLVIAGAVLGLATLAVVVFAVAAILAAPHLRDGANEARAALSAARRGDTTEAEERLARSSEAFGVAQGYTGGPWALPARLVPVVSQHVDAVHVATDQGLAMTEAGTSVARVGDYQDLRYESGRIDLGQVRELTAPLGRASQVLGAAQARFATLDRSWLVTPFDDELDDLVVEVGGAAEEASMAARAVEAAPGLLGADGPRTYFVAFVNTAEERGGGGFLGAYGELTAIDGELELTRSGPIRELISARRPGERTLDGPADYLDRYGQFSPADFFQDVTFSPHFPYTADVIGQLYPQSGGTEVDGVISLDPYALAALLEFTGPIDVPDYDEPLTADNAADVILREQYLTFADEDNSLRRDLLTDASEIAFDELTAGSLPGPEQLIEVMGPMVRERRLQLAATEPIEQDLFEAIGADGALPPPDGSDAFMVAHQNFGNSKIDAYLQRSVDYDVRVDPSTGAVASTATITMRNDAPPDGLPRIVIGNGRDAPFGTNLMVLSLYSPLELTGAELDGADLTMIRSNEAGLATYTARVDVPPLSTRTLTVSLEGGVDLSAGRYDLTVMPQAMVNPDEISVDVAVVDGWRLGVPGGGTGPEATFDDDAPGQPVEVAAPITTE
jgi:hypothetical protein